MTKSEFNFIYCTDFGWKKQVFQGAPQTEGDGVLYVRRGQLHTAYPALISKSRSKYFKAHDFFKGDGVLCVRRGLGKSCNTEMRRLLASKSAVEEFFGLIYRLTGEVYTKLSEGCYVYGGQDY